MAGPAPREESMYSSLRYPADAAVHVPAPMKRAIAFIEKYGLTTTYILQKSGDADQVVTLTDRWARGEDVDLNTVTLLTAHDVAAALKMYFLELGEPLLMYINYSKFINAGKMTDGDAKTAAVKTLLRDVPRRNQGILRYLIIFLRRVVMNSKYNKMTFFLVANVFGPGVLSAPEMTSEHMANVRTISTLLADMVDNYVEIFGVEDDRARISEAYAIFAAADTNVEFQEWSAAGGPVGANVADYQPEDADTEAYKQYQAVKKRQDRGTLEMTQATSDERLLSGVNTSQKSREGFGSSYGNSLAGSPAKGGKSGAFSIDEEYAKSVLSGAESAAKVGTRYGSTGAYGTSAADANESVDERRARITREVQMQMAARKGVGNENLTQQEAADEAKVQGLMADTKKSQYERSMKATSALDDHEKDVRGGILAGDAGVRARLEASVGKTAVRSMLDNGERSDEEEEEEVDPKEVRREQLMLERKRAAQEDSIRKKLEAKMANQHGMKYTPSASMAASRANSRGNSRTGSRRPSAQGLESMPEGGGGGGGGGTSGGGGASWSPAGPVPPLSSSAGLGGQHDDSDDDYDARLDAEADAAEATRREHIEQKKVDHEAVLRERMEARMKAHGQYFLPAQSKMKPFIAKATTSDGSLCEPVKVMKGPISLSSAVVHDTVEQLFTPRTLVALQRRMLAPVRADMQQALRKETEEQLGKAFQTADDASADAATLKKQLTEALPELARVRAENAALERALEEKTFTLQAEVTKLKEERAAMVESLAAVQAEAARVVGESTGVLQYREDQLREYENSMTEEIKALRIKGNGYKRSSYALMKQKQREADSESSLDRFRRDGFVVFEHTFGSRPKREAKFMLLNGTGTINWGDAKQKKANPKKALAVKSIQSVIYGPTSAEFNKRTMIDDNDWMCLSIVMQGNVTIDLSAQNEEDLPDLLIALNALAVQTQSGKPQHGPDKRDTAVQLLSRGSVYTRRLQMRIANNATRHNLSVQTILMRSVKKTVKQIMPEAEQAVVVPPLARRITFVGVFKDKHPVHYVTGQVHKAVPPPPPSGAQRLKAVTSKGLNQFIAQMERSMLVKGIKTAYFTIQDGFSFFTMMGDDPMFRQGEEIVKNVDDHVVSSSMGLTVTNFEGTVNVAGNPLVNAAYKVELMPKDADTGHLILDPSGMYVLRDSEGSFQQNKASPTKVQLMLDGSLVAVAVPGTGATWKGRVVVPGKEGGKHTVTGFSQELMGACEVDDQTISFASGIVWLKVTPEQLA